VTPADQAPSRGVVAAYLPPRPGWTAKLGWQGQVLALYLLSRLVAIAGVWGAVAIRHRSLHFVLTRWDARWYVWVAEHGYPRSTRFVVYDFQSPHSFFPLYPLLVRGLGPAFGRHLLVAGLALNLVLGAVLALALRALFAEVAPEAATRSAALVLFFPGSFVLSLAYSEALALTCAALALLALMRHRWLLAGLAGAAATAARPSMVAVVAAAAVAALLAIRDRGDWRALLAPLLSPVGVGAYLFYLHEHTGQWDAWQRAEAKFGQHRDFLRVFFRRLPRELGQAFSGNHANYTIYLASLGVLVVLLLLALRRPRMHPVLAAYTLTVVALTVSYSAVNARPRFLLVMFPLVLAYARPLGQRTSIAAGVISGALMAATMYMYLGATHVIP